MNEYSSDIQTAEICEEHKSAFTISFGRRDNKVQLYFAGGQLYFNLEFNFQLLRDIVGVPA